MSIACCRSARAVACSVRRAARALARPAHRLGAPDRRGRRGRRGRRRPRGPGSRRGAATSRPRTRSCVYQADPEPTTWTRACIRQADLLLLVADATTSPEPPPHRAVRVQCREVAHSRIELVLVHPAWTEDPRGHVAVARAAHRPPPPPRPHRPDGRRRPRRAARPEPGDRHRLQRRWRAGSPSSACCGRCARRTSRSTPPAARASARSWPARPRAAWISTPPSQMLRDGARSRGSRRSTSRSRPCRSRRVRACRSGCRTRRVASTSRTRGSTASACPPT